MAGNKVFEEIVYQIVTLLKQGDLYPRYVESIDAGKKDYKISQVYTKKNYSTDWIDTIEDCIVALDTIVRNPRRFIVIEEDIVDISLARSISVESIKHLSQHTNLISSVTKDGMVIPSKILNTSKEESFEIYENRFIYTLLLKIRDFIEIRSNAIKNALMQSGEIEVGVESEFSLDRHKVRYKMSGAANFPFDEAVRKGGGGVSDFERITRIRSIINDFLSSPFAKEMRSCALVRPPIQRTNVILKDPNFKKALVLWQFIETSEKMEYKIETSTETVDMNPVLEDKYRAIVYLNTILMQSIAATHETAESVERAQEKDKVIADEYVTKNIDDFVPDDFPQLKMDLQQIRTIYKKVPTENSLTVTQIAKINAALDRVIRQVRINKMKEDSAMRQRLIAKQLEEEQQAKLLALREKKDIERQARAERARKRLEARKAEEERAAELKRLAEEAAALKAKREAEEARIRQHQQEIAELRAREQDYLDTVVREEEARLAAFEVVAGEARQARDTAQAEYDRDIAAFHAEETALEEERRRLTEAWANHAAEEATRKAKQESLIKRAKEDSAQAERLRVARVDTLKRLQQQSTEYWEGEKRKARDLEIEKILSELSTEERAVLDRILGDEREELNVLAEIERGFQLNLEADRLQHFREMAEIAYRHRTEKELQRTVRKNRLLLWWQNRKKDDK